MKEIESNLKKLEKELDKLQEKKEKAFELMQKSQLNYIKVNHETKMKHITLSKMLRQTRPERRVTTRLRDDYKKKIVKEVGKCEECGHENRLNLTVHHITELGMGGTNDRKNLKVLCYECHSKYHPI